MELSIYIFARRWDTARREMWNMREDQNLVIKVKHGWIALCPTMCRAETQKETQQFVLIVSCVMKNHWGIKIIKFSFTPTIITVIKSCNNLWFDVCCSSTKQTAKNKTINHLLFPATCERRKMNLSAFYQNAFYAETWTLPFCLYTDLLHH